MTLDRGASIVIVFDELVALEETIDSDLRVYRLQPDQIEPPAIFNWILPTKTSIPDNWSIEDDFRVAATIVVPGGHMGHAASLLTYADRFREVVGPALVASVLNGTKPLNGATRRAQINRWGGVSETFNGVPLVGIQFELGIQLAIHTPS